MTNSEKIVYSIIVCVNNQALFNQFIKTLKNTNITNYEIVKIENNDGVYTLPEALNSGINRAKGSFYFFCHQDIHFPISWLDTVILQIGILNKKDQTWGVLGIMGVTSHGFFAGNIIDPHTRAKMGKLPCEVVALDEVCLIMKKESQLRFDESLGGFHLYGADICLQAQQASQKCYAIDAPFEHLSSGKVDSAFWKIAEKFKIKWSKIRNSPCTLETTCGVFQLKLGVRGFLAYYFKIVRRKLIQKLQGRHKMRTNT